MICPKCGGKLLVEDTVKNPQENEDYRKKACRDCGHTFYTVEYEVIPNRSFTKAWTRYYRKHTEEGK